ncbi:unnamed protein product [Rotaria sp. Silwood1]|nr:unnamed protein product [Rotaria sp. Silwood1]
MIQSYPDGAPINTCSSMMPFHGVNSRPCQSNYVIEANKYQYSSDDTIQIIVRGATSSNLFKGILLVAKDSSGQNILGSWSSTDSSVLVISCFGILLIAKGSNGQNILGNWSSIDSSVLVISCFGTSSTSITHASSTTKSQIQATWSSPSSVAQENVVIKSFAIVYQTSMPLVDTTTINSQVSGAPLNLKWTYLDGITTVVIVTNNLGTSQWLGIGLSLDDQMGDDHVFVCQRLNDDTIQLQRFINPGGYSSPTIATADSNYGGIFKVTRVALNNGMVYCEFTLSNFTTTTGRRRKRSISILSQNTQYRILTAVGQLDSSSSLLQHSSVTVQTKMMQLNQPGTIALINIEGSENDRKIFLRAHGIIMLFIWMLFVSTGIFIARYFKQSWPKRKLCDKPVWFAVHRLIMIFAAIMTLIAFAAILKYKHGTWISQNLSREFAHSISGVLVVGAAIIQPMMALFRCHPDHQHRFIFNYVDAMVGIGALIFSIATIFLATLFTIVCSIDWLRISQNFLLQELATIQR